MLRRFLGFFFFFEWIEDIASVWFEAILCVASLQLAEHPSPSFFYVAAQGKMIDGVSPVHCQRLEQINGQETPACSPSCVIVWRRAHILTEVISCFSGFLQSVIEGWDSYQRLKGASHKETVYYLGQLSAFHLANSTRPEACFQQAAVLFTHADVCVCFFVFAGTASCSIAQMARRSLICYQLFYLGDTDQFAWAARSDRVWPRASQILWKGIFGGWPWSQIQPWSVPQFLSCRTGIAIG